MVFAPFQFSQETLYAVKLGTQLAGLNAMFSSPLRTNNNILITSPTGLSEYVPSGRSITDVSSPIARRMRRMRRRRRMRKTNSSMFQRFIKYPSFFNLPK